MKLWSSNETHLRTIFKKWNISQKVTDECSNMDKSEDGGYRISYYATIPFFLIQSISFILLQGISTPQVQVTDQAFQVLFLQYNWKLHCDQVIPKTD